MILCDALLVPHIDLVVVCTVDGGAKERRVNGLLRGLMI
jgi:hypothetical protein